MVWKKRVCIYTKACIKRTAVQHCLVVKNALETFSEGKLLRLSAMQKVGQRIYRNGQNHKDHVKNKESFKHDCIRKYKR